MWEENWQVFSFYRQFHDQWRMGPAGPYALDLPFFISEMKERGIVGEEREIWLFKLRIIANQAQIEMHQ